MQFERETWRTFNFLLHKTNTP